MASHSIIAKGLHKNCTFSTLHKQLLGNGSGAPIGELIRIDGFSMVSRGRRLCKYKLACGAACALDCRNQTSQDIMSSKADFDKAAEEAKTLPDKTSNDDKLILYALFKQATVGDCNTSKPGMLDMKGKAKWEAWNKLKGKDQSTAQEEYIMKVSELKEKYGS